MLQIEVFNLFSQIVPGEQSSSELISKDDLELQTRKEQEARSQKNQNMSSQELLTINR